jgi:23S rRNA (uracil1939-C5)-methyltransferase
MGRARKASLPEAAIELDIEDLSHDGRGVSRAGEKVVFVDGALPGERVAARLTGRRRSYEEATAEEILLASPHRVAPPCPHFGDCGGCSLQHLDPLQQIAAKQETLAQNFARIGKLAPLQWYDPLTGPLWHYRRKARLSVRYVFKKERVLVGFRERLGRYVADMAECHVLDSRIADCLPRLPDLIRSLETYRRIPQVEVACGDTVAALVFRHLDPLPDEDREKLRVFSLQSEIAVLVQPAGPETIEPVEPANIELNYSLPAHGVTIHFEPADFIQVNAEMNRLMVDRAIVLLAPQLGERVLDLFCGLGNFTLPLARRAGEAVGVEGDSGLVKRARRNAERNGLDNAEFHCADLTLDPGHSPWLRRAYDKVLIDPPRSGAEEMLPHIAASGASRLVYVSCHPGSLARDAGILVRDHGFRLEGAGVMDMFPHTSHVESIAMFERG